jgi:hypothetical protein
MAASLEVSCQLRVEFCTGGCEGRTWVREAEESPLLEAVCQGTTDEDTADWQMA